MEITSTYSFSSNYPPLLNDDISRDNIIEILITTLKSNDVIFLTGDEEIGKTTFLGQFGRKNSKSVISCFIKPINEFSTNLENILFDLIAQVYFITTETEFKEDITATSEVLQKYLTKLSRQMRNKIFYILLDGFEGVDTKNAFQLASLFDILPFGYNNFKFIISETNNKVKNAFFSGAKMQSLKTYNYPFAAFSFDEATRFLADPSLEKYQVSEIMKITNSLPGRIKVIVDSKVDGHLNYDEIQNAKSFTDLLDKQWGKIDRLDDDLRMFLAILSHEQNNSIDFIIKLLSIDKKTLDGYISRIQFLDIDGQSIKFNSPVFKSYSKNKLLYLKNKVAEAVISYLNQTLSSVDSILELPRRLEQTNDFKSLLTLMTESNFKTIIKQKESLSFIEEQTNFGIKAAAHLEQHIDLYRLTLQKSCITEVKKTYIWKTEIEAKIELKDFDSAMELANQSIFKEEKFKLIAFIARKKKTKGLNVEENTLDLIQTLYKQIDINNYFSDEDTVDIATDLLYTFPNLAIEVIEKSSGKGMSNSSDWGFAKLALLLRNMKETNSGNEETLEIINSRIKSPTVKNISSAFGYLYGDQSVESFVAKCQELETNLEKLQIVRLYLSENYKSNNIAYVVDYALDILLLASTEIPISATILKELSLPLLYIEKNQKLLALSEKFHSLKAISKEKGPTVNHVKYSLHLAMIETKFDKEKGSNELYEIFEYIDSLKDIGIKTECFAIFYSYLSDLYKEIGYNQLFDLEKDILPIIKQNYKYLIDNISQHYQMARPIINEIAKINPTLALEFCKNINTRYRRDYAYQIALITYLENDVDTIDFQIVDGFYQSIIDIKIKNEACSRILEKYSENPTCPDIAKSPLIKYIKRIDDFYQSQDKSYTYINAIKIAYLILKSDLYTDKLLDIIYQFLTNLDDRHEKIDYGFRVSTALIPFNREKAILFHDLAENEKATLELDSPISLTLYYNAIRLSLNSFNGVVQASLESEEQINILIEYITFLPNISQQKSLITHLLFILLKNNKHDLCKKVYDENIKSFLQGFITNDVFLTESEKFDLIIQVSPLAHIYQRDTLKLVIDKMPSVYRDFCYDSICEYVIKKRVPDQAPRDEQTMKISVDEALSVIDLLKNMSTDYLISYRIQEIRTGLKNSQIPSHTLLIIATALQELIKSKFPDSNNITHDGYIHLCEAYVLSITNNVKEEHWKDIFKKIDAIPNKSDNIYVESIVASILPNKLQALKESVLKKTLIEIDNISSYTERVHRYCDIKDYVKTINISECKTSLRKAINDSLFENDSSMFDMQKSIIDFAYDISEDFSDELMKIIDLDPARKPLTYKLKKHVRTKTLRDNIVNDKSLDDLRNTKYLAEACGMLTMQLNSNRIPSKHLNKTIDWLLNAHKFPISETFPIYMCFIENLNSRFAKPDHPNRHYTLQMFEQGIKSLQLIKILAIKSKNKVITTKDIIISQDKNYLLVKSGEREKALNFIRRWAQNEVVDYLKVCDPYFTFNDLELIKEIFLLKPETKFTILGQYNNLGANATSQIFSEKWYEICDQDPPEILIVMVGVRGAQESVKIIPSPNHDRWYITYNSGLTVGNSFSGLGLNKNCGIQVMSSTSAKEIEIKIIDKYIREEEKLHDNMRLLYDKFSIR